MPTMRQIRLDPALRDRLAGEVPIVVSPSSARKRKRRFDHTGQKEEDSNVEDVQNNSARVPPMPQTSSVIDHNYAASGGCMPTSAQIHVPIRTPSALLSRDPAQLSSSLNQPLNFIKNVRASVADAIIMDPNSGHGGSAAETVAIVTKLCVEKEFVTRECCQDIDITSKTQEGKSHNRKWHGKRGNNPQFGGAFHQKLRPPPVILGAVTGLDMCAQSFFVHNLSGYKQSDTQFIGTGSQALDDLLQPDHSCYTCRDGWSLPYPYKITIINSTVQSSKSRGISFGMVTEFSGAPGSGKTQLALSIASRAAMTQHYQIYYLASGGGAGGSRVAIARRFYSLCLAIATNHAQNNLPVDDVSEEQRIREVKALASHAVQRIHISSVSDAYSLLAMLARIEKEEQSAENRDVKGSILIIDSVSGCLGRHLSGGYSTIIGASLVNQVSSTLRRMAKTLDGRIHGDGKSFDDVGLAKALRRFAIVTTNGSVAKQSSPSDANSINTTAMNFRTHRPAMGNYWQVSDVGIWLEEERPDRDDDGINFLKSEYAVIDASGIEGLTLVSKKVIIATLQNHYGNSCYTRANSYGGKQFYRKRRNARILLGAKGIFDVL